MRLRFGRFVLDDERRELSRSGHALHLTPKAFDLLQYLAEKRPAAVTQEELFDHLWPHTLVDTSRIHQLIQEIRQQLGDSDRRIIRTVYRHGFAFDGAATLLDAAEPARWQFVIRGVAFPLQKGENLIGRDSSATVKIDSPSVSRRHALVVVTDAGLAIEDLGSRNGTSVGGRRVEGVTNLAHGDQLLLGGVEAIVAMIEPALPTQPILPL